jgi:GAF domain-containing protein
MTAESAPASAKRAAYQALSRELATLLGGDDWSATAVMSTLAALLYERLEAVGWVGFYLKRSPELLEIGPYQGHLACMRIPLGRGVCGAAARRGQTVIVPDVAKFDGYIACAASTRSEIVVPLKDAQGVWGVLDLDSDALSAFDEIDALSLEAIGRLIPRPTSL